MEWSQDETLQFLELYQAETVIWDPKHRLHKNSQRINDAWKQISEIMCKPIAELKVKKNSLMATFRQHLRRKKQSIKSGASVDEIYNPIWVYYDIMEKFLAPVYKCDKTLSTEDEPINSPMTEEEETANENKEKNSQSVNENEEIEKKTFRSPLKKSAKRKNTDIDDLQKDIKDTVSCLNNLVANKNKIDDECDMYAKILATRLREYTTMERRRIMHGIDGFLLANPPQNLQNENLCSPTHSFPSSSGSYRVISSQSSQSPVHISVQDRPASHNNFFLQPQSPIQISIPDRPLSHESAYSYLIEPSPSSTAAENRVRVLSQQIIQPSRIINQAYNAAINDNDE